ncbi:hypothetical protein C8T65DRAFT_228623 [Cerioporus squamosus]|nr:hypothetical protein C8T65DRAFT_228623 [Cerioporus squamosus]
MDRNSPGYYVEPSPEASVAATRDIIAHIRSLPPAQGMTEPLVGPILTARFAISCTSELLSELGKRAPPTPPSRSTRTSPRISLKSCSRSSCSRRRPSSRRDGQAQVEEDDIRRGVRRVRAAAREHDPRARRAPRGGRGRAHQGEACGREPQPSGQ